MKLFKQYKKQQGIGAVRLKLGLSQEAFATRLGISRSLLSKVENMQRHLPFAALQILSGIEHSLAQYPLRHKGDQAATNGAVQWAANVEQAGRAAEVAGLQHKLEQMQARYDALEYSLECIDRLIAQEQQKAPRVETSYLQMQFYHLLTKKERCSPRVQTRLQQRILMLKACQTLQESHALATGPTNGC